MKERTGGHSARLVRTKKAYKILVRKPEVRDRFEKVGRIILKWILKDQVEESELNSFA
jgi:hypothetical protein